MCLAQGPQPSDAGEARTRYPSVSSQALNHWATALPYPSILTYVLGAQKIRLNETVLLSTHNMFWLRNKRTHFQLRTLTGKGLVKLG